MSDEYRRRRLREIEALLRQGYGVEDIAVLLECDVNEVRDLVAVYRATGNIDNIIWRPWR